MNSYLTGSFIKKLREENNMTQNELALKLGVSGKTVSKWETGKGYPDITLIEPISASLGVSVADLFSCETVKNKNTAFNMKKSVFYVCPVCNNVIFSAGEASVSCHGITLPPIEAEEPDNAHDITVSTVEDEYFVNLNHPMSKEHYISFLAAVSDNGISVIKLYPEGSAQARFKKDKTEFIYAFCNRHGLFKIKPESTCDYQSEARKKWQETAAFKEWEEKKKSDVDNTASGDGLMWIFAKFGKIKNENPSGEKAQMLLSELKNFITENYYTCTDEILKSLGEMYVNDGRFKKNIDCAGGEGTAEFVNKVIKSK